MIMFMDHSTWGHHTRTLRRSWISLARPRTRWVSASPRMTATRTPRYSNIARPLCGYGVGASSPQFSLVHSFQALGLPQRVVVGPEHIGDEALGRVDLG